LGEVRALVVAGDEEQDLRSIFAELIQLGIEVRESVCERSELYTS
jgi:hypothetical protein